MSLYHEKTDSWTEAMRELKRYLENVDLHTNAYLVYSEYQERYMITHDEDEISKWIHESWIDGGCDLSPDEEAESFHVYCYVSEKNKFKYPNLYEDYKPTLLNTKQTVYRKKLSVEPAHSVEFTIPNY